MSIKEISTAFTETLRNSDLQDVSGDISGVVLDNLILQGVLKDVPVINILLNLQRGVSQVQDQLFLRKIVAFLSKSKEISANDRRIMIDKINSSKQHRMKVGEKLLDLSRNSR